jgi:hypothetical protein
MKLIKVLGLALISLVAMAFIGAGSATADLLCSVDKGINGECPFENRYAVATTIKALTPTNEPALFLIENGIEMECHSFIKAKTATNEGAHIGLKGVLEEMTFTNCKSDVCEGVENESAENLPFKILLVGLNQHVLVSKESATPAMVLKKCVPFFEIDCLIELEAEPSLIDLTLATATKDAHFTALKLPMKSSSPGCPKKFLFDALYVASEPLPLFLTSLP